MLNCYKLKETQVPDIVKMFYGKLKYDEEYVFEKKYFDAEAYYGSANTILDKISNLKLQIDQIKYRDGNLCVDGHVHPILAAMAILCLVARRKYLFTAAVIQEKRLWGRRCIRKR